MRLITTSSFLIFLASVTLDAPSRGQGPLPTWTDVRGVPAFQATIANLHPQSSEVAFQKPDGSTLVASMHDLGPAALEQLRRAVPPNVRPWRSGDGRFQTEGSLLAIDGDQITLWIDNRLVDVPLAKLSQADRQHVRQVALQRVVQRVLMVKTFDAFDRQIGFGSAFYVDQEGWLATNYHVIQGASRVEVQIAGQVHKINECVAVDRANDLVILPCLAAKELYPPLRLATQLPDVGDEIWAIGFPNGLPNSSPGTVGNLPKTQAFPMPFRAFLQEQRDIPFPNDTQWIQVQQAVLLPGNSGGPLIDGSGGVLGVNTWVAAGAFGQAVAASHLADLRNRARQQPAPQPLPLPPVQREPTAKWLHPDVAAVIKQTPIGNLGPQQQALQAVRNQLMAGARQKPKDWSAKQAAFLVSQLSLSDPNGNRWIADASGLLLKHHAGSHAIPELAMQFAACNQPAAGEYCSQVIDNPGFAQETRAAACVALLSNLLWQLDAAQGETPQQLQPLRKEIDATLQRWRKEFGNETLTLTQNAFGQIQVAYDRLPIPSSPEFLRLSVEAQMNGQQNQNPPTFPLAALADEIAYYFDHLSIGATAQNFAGKNVNGDKVQLQRLAGCVVLLDFFADWCGPCRSMYPFERKLASRSQEDPKWKGKFKLVGVTKDPVEAIKKKIAADEITWDVCFDQPPQGQPPVLEMYRVTSYPTMLLLDKNGVIRYRWLGVKPGLENQLTAAIAELVAE